MTSSITVPINQLPRTQQLYRLTEKDFFDPRQAHTVELDIKVTVGGSIDSFVLGVWRWNDLKQHAYRVSTTKLIILSAAGELHPAPDVVVCSNLSDILSYGEKVNISGWFHDGDAEKGKRWYISTEYELLDQNTIRLLPKNFTLNLVEGQRFHISPAEITFVQEFKVNGRKTAVTLESVQGNFLKNIHEFSISIDAIPVK